MIRGARIEQQDELQDTEIILLLLLTWIRVSLWVEATELNDGGGQGGRNGKEKERNHK